MVDREFDRARFHRPAKHSGQTAGRVPQLRLAPRRRRPRAHAQAATRSSSPAPSEEAREAAADGREPDLGLVGDAGSWQTIVAPRGHHESLAETSPQIAFEMLARARDVTDDRAQCRRSTEYLQVVQNCGPQAGALTDHLCLDFYDLPQIPHRIGEELGGAARFVIREGVCPFCRLVRDEVAEPTRLVYEDAASVCFAPYASRSPFELWVVPRHHEADFGAATDAQLVSAADTLQSVLRLLAALGGPPTTCPAHRAAARTRRRDLSLALGDPPAPARDRRAGAGHGPAGQPGQPGRGRHGAARPPREERHRDRCCRRSARTR